MSAVTNTRAAALRYFQQWVESGDFQPLKTAIELAERACEMDAGLAETVREGRKTETADDLRHQAVLKFEEWVETGNSAAIKACWQLENQARAIEEAKR